MTPAGGYYWTEELTGRACALAGKGATAAEIAKQLGISRSAVYARFDRLRVAADPRVPASPRKRLEALTTLAPIDAMAEVMARGAPNVRAAARRLKVPEAEALRLWYQIVRGRGAQAA